MIYPLAFPSQAPATERLVLNRRQSATASSWTYKQQVVQTAAQWALQWTWPPVTHLTAEALDAWLLSLKGQIGTFRYAPRQRYTSPIIGTTLAQPGYAYNDSIAVSGWAASAGTNLRAGQYFQIGDQLLRLTQANAFADANGFVTISFVPELRIAYSAGTAVNFVNPTGLFRLASSDGSGYTLTTDRLPDLGTLNANEAV